MAFFLKTGFSSGSGGESSIYNNFQERQIIIDRKYKDNFSGDINSDKYFEETKNNINLALQQGPTPAKRITLLKEMEDLNKDQIKYSVSKNNIGKDGLAEAKADMEDTWKSIWSNKNIIKTGAFNVIADKMAEAAEEDRETLIDLKKNLSEQTTNEEVLDDIQKIIDYYDDQGSFYRGVITNPQRYRVDFNTNENGDIMDVKLKNINDNANGYMDSHQKSADGLAIYGKPNVLLTTESGEKGFNIGGTVFTGTDTGTFYPQDDAKLDVANFKIQDSLNYQSGVAMKASNGTIYIKNDDGTYMKSDEAMAKELGVDLSDPISLSDRNTKEIERSFDVTDYNERYKKRKEIIERGDRELEDLLGDNIGRYSPLEQVFTEGPKRFFKKAIDSARTEHEINIENQGPIKKAVRETGLKFGASVKKEAKRKIQSKVDVAQNIFKGVGSALNKFGNFARGFKSLGDSPTEKPSETFKP